MRRRRMKSDATRSTRTHTEAGSLLARGSLHARSLSCAARTLHPGTWQPASASASLADMATLQPPCPARPSVCSASPMSETCGIPHPRSPVRRCPSVSAPARSFSMLGERQQSLVDRLGVPVHNDRDHAGGLTCCCECCADDVQAEVYNDAEQRPYADRGRSGTDESPSGSRVPKGPRGLSHRRSDHTGHSDQPNTQIAPRHGWMDGTVTQAQPIA